MVVERLNVVPLVGTWIEICKKWGESKKEGVVPLVGTWIEIRNSEKQHWKGRVVPLVGTWIEISLLDIAAKTG